MPKGSVAALFISPAAGAPMQWMAAVEAIAGKGLKGDRYATGEGSFNKDKPGERQVTLINAHFFVSSGFQYVESRRNIVTWGVELMWLIGREFAIGNAIFRGLKYCDPCTRPNKLIDKKAPLFRDAFHDTGGIIAEVLKGGLITANSAIIPPPKGY
jgi:hypothetical protein